MGMDAGLGAKSRGWETDQSRKPVGSPDFAIRFYLFVCVPALQTGRRQYCTARDKSLVYMGKLAVLGVKTLEFGAVDGYNEIIEKGDLGGSFA